MTLRLLDSHIKSLLHFNFPHFAESGDGLADDAAKFSWSRSGNAKLAASQSPADIIITGTPRFGYRCLHTESNSDYITGTASTAISLPQIEASMWVRPTASGTGNILVLKSSASTIFTLSLNADNKLVLSSSLLSLNFTSSETLSLNLWSYVRLQVSASRANISVNNSSGTSATVASSTSGGTSISIPIQIPAVSSISLGGFHGQIDEFILRDEFTATLPAEPVKASLNVNDIGGFGSGALGNVTLSSNCIMNTTGFQSGATKDNGLSFLVEHINVGKFGDFKVGGEVLIHEQGYHDYCFRTITKIEPDSHGYYLTFNAVPRGVSSNLLLGYGAVIQIPHFNTLTVNSGVTISPANEPIPTHGIVAFRVKGDCTINGSIITSGKGQVRMSPDWESYTNAKAPHHSRLPDCFVCGTGGGIFIACGGTLTIPASARLGATWSGAAMGGAANGGLHSGGGAGYGGGSGKSSGSVSGLVGYGGFSTSTQNLGAAPGRTVMYSINDIPTSGTADSTCSPSAGATVYIVARKLKVDEAAISTGGENAPVNSNPEAYGAGAGYCYIACKEML